MIKSKLVCQTNLCNYVGVEFDKVNNNFNYWQYPTSMISWGFIGQWRLKKLTNKE